MSFSVGLTGGIGSGKSTVAELLRGYGAGIVDTDAISHSLTAAGGEAIPAIRERFGAAFVADDGSLDRARMREFVFRDAGAKAQLESILHPMIRDEAQRQAALASHKAPYLVFVVPLLIESGTWRSRVTRLLVIDCSVATQMERVCRRSGWTRDAALAVIRLQVSRAERLAAADDVLVNEGDTRALAVRVARLHAAYLEGARTHPADAGGTIASP
jgi:dephospho-CoA kinase